MSEKAPEMNHAEKSTLGFEVAKHDKIIVGMFAELGGEEVVEIIKYNEADDTALIQTGEGDTEHVSRDKLIMLQTTEAVKHAFDGEELKEAA